MPAAVALTRASRTIYSRGAFQSLRTQHGAERRIPALAALARYYASKSFPNHTVISMPALSPTMTSGGIGTWQKKPGDSVAPGDVLVEIETDKAQMDFEYQEEGVIAKILKESGEKEVAVGSPIAVLVEDAGDVEAFAEFTVEDAGGDKAPPSSGNEKGQEAADASEPPQQDTKTSPPPQDEKGEKRSVEKDEAPAAVESDSTGEVLQLSIDREAASPAVKKLALEKGVSLSALKGTGKGGRITKEDVEKFKPAASAPAVAASGSAESYEDTPASSMRKTIASRLKTSMNENPHYFVASAISVSKLLKLRQALNSSADGAYKLSVNDFLIKAVAVAARKVPVANSSWRENGKDVYIRQHNVVDVSVAVATPIGLMTPIVKNAHAIGLETISSQVKDLGKRARDGKLKPEEYQGGTITISNMGMNDAIDRFTAVINPPQATIVAVGAVKKVAVPKAGEEDEPSFDWDEQIVITGSFDHKVVDGAVGGQFMKELKKVVENPLELML